ncbi:hypothetical protein RI129_002317 [Pyrocoelia pectoralis]|uniref:Uncharacterized protein n=1 Tax=Pyrocoelia pectoralis TaxID=417401 RepID=A0AAN7VF34_9COLE
MALSISSRQFKLLRNLHFLRTKSMNKYFCNHQENILTLDSDTLDTFTTQLMQRKCNKWETDRIKQNSKLEPIQIKFQMNKKVAIDLTNVDNILCDALEADNEDCITNVIEECIKFRTVPDMSNFLQILSYFARRGDKVTILKLIELSKLFDDTILLRYSYFKHYIAEVTWTKGNINEAIILFEEVYSSNIYLRRRIRSMLNNLVSDSIRGRSEAVLFLMLNFAKRLGNNYRDYYTLACIWRNCILSEWFTDQSIALDLLENDEKLRKTVMNHIPIVVHIALREHQIDLAYRILEVLMKCESKIQYAKIVEILFDYRVRQQDLQGCTKIIQWCAIHGINLPMFQQEQYINLLCTSNNNEVPDNRGKSHKASTYHFKF